MIFARYFAYRFTKSFALTLALITAVLILIDLIEQLRRFSSEGISFLTALEIAAFNAPAGIYQLFPMLTILAALALILSMSRSSELVALRAAGRSGLRGLSGPLIASFLIGIIGLCGINPLVAITQQEYTRLRAAAGDQKSGNLLLQNGVLWLREATDDGQIVIRAKRADILARSLKEITLLQYDSTGRLRARIESDSAILKDRTWHLENVWEWRFEAGRTSRPDQYPDMKIASRSSWDRIINSVSPPNQITIWQLPRYIKDIERAGLSATAHRVRLHNELAQPVLMMAMVMLVAGLTMRHNRAQGRVFGIMAAVLGGFGIFFIRNIAQILGQNGQIPVFAAAWAAPLTAILLSLALLLHMEDG